MGFLMNRQTSAAPKRTRNLGVQATARKNFSKRLRFEQLEDRRLLAIDLSISDGSAVEGSNTLKFIDAQIGGQSGDLVTPYGMTLGPDGNLYVSSLNGDSVLRYNAVTGAPLPAPGKTGSVFVSAGSGGLDGARMIAFGPGDDLYVVSEFTNSVLRYDGTTGNFESTLVAPGSGGLYQPRALVFHTDGYLYMASVFNDETGQGADAILRYDAITGAPAGLSGNSGDAVFIAHGDHGLDNPSQILFHSGKIYIASTAGYTSNSIMRYALDGTYVDTFVATGSGGLYGPVDMVFSPDGFFYVASWANDRVIRYDGTTGAPVDIPIEGAGLDSPIGLILNSDGTLLVSSRLSNQIRRYGPSSLATFTVNLSSPSTSQVSVQYGTNNGTAIADADYLATSGTLTFAPGQTSRTVFVHTLDDLATEGSETFYVNLSNPVGANIADGQGVAIIIDNEVPATKFYVVNDGSPDRTYEYSATGSSIENYSINSGNTSPRGAASNVAGDTVWVADKNRKVYVYDTSGGLLGSWSAGTLASNALVEGIATNGTDVWIVDSKSDKVFRYSGAASRISGSQNAASSFSLNSGNGNSKGIVTDGTHLWVVNDSTTDKVFKYTAFDNIPVVGVPAGTLKGSWTIDTANKTPTGLTIDPTGASQSIWIVDSGTDKVYEYGSARGNSGGSLIGSFALAAGNTNPQGIADPPPPGTRLQSTTASLTPTSLSLAPRYDQSTPTVVTPTGAGISASDPRRDERASRVDQALVMPGSPKLQLRDSNVSAVPPVRSQRLARADQEDAREAFDEALLDVLAEAELVSYASDLGS